jgi:hypothetical protein
MKATYGAVQPAMKGAGYRRSGSTFRRIIEPDGLVHVVGFQRGGFIQMTPGDLQVTTPYGGFTVNLGVWLPGVERALHPLIAPADDSVRAKTIRAGSCHLQSRLGTLLPVPADYWWPVSEDSEAGEIVAEALSDYGLPWLGRFVSWDQILRQFEEGPANSSGTGGTARLLAMAMRLARSQHDEAERDFAEHLTYLATQPMDAISRAFSPNYSVAPFIESLARHAVAHDFTVDVQAYAEQARRRERDEAGHQPK